MTAATEIILRLDLESDALFIDAPTSAGPQETLSTIPGGVLLGLLARWYAEIEAEGGPDLSWRVFHAGGLRFGNGLPLVNGQPLVPLPRSWTAEKKARGEKPSDDESRMFVSEDGRVRHQVATRLARRTAIDDKTGRVRGGFLFAYRALTEGQSFISRVTVAPEAKAALPFLARLYDRTWRIGRSRHAEYGRVRITRLDDPPALPAHSRTRDAVRLLAVSDVAPTKHGRLDVDLFGLPDTWQPCPGKTFVAWRALSVYNGHRRAFDRERQVIVPGSVLAFTGPALLPDQANHLRATLDAGVGLGTERGLGACLANPPVLERAKEAVDQKPPTAVVPAAPPDDPLFAWLTRRHAARTLGDDARTIARAFEPLFKTLYETQWREARVSGRALGDLAPSPSQWGAVRDEANRATNLDDLNGRLFDKDTGYCAAGVGARVWNEEAPGLTLLKDKPASARALLEAAIDPKTLCEHATADVSDADRAELARLVVADLAVHVPRLMADLAREEEAR